MMSTIYGPRGEALGSTDYSNRREALTGYRGILPEAKPTEVTPEPEQHTSRWLLKAYHALRLDR